MKLAIITFITAISLSCSHSIYAASFCDYDVKSEVQKITRSESMSEQELLSATNGRRLVSTYSRLSDQLRHTCSVSGGSRFEESGRDLKKSRYNDYYKVTVYGVCVTTAMIEKSEEEIAKERCEKLNKCEEKILDSSDIGSPELKKITYLLERYKC